VDRVPSIEAETKCNRQRSSWPFAPLKARPRPRMELSCATSVSLAPNAGKTMKCGDQLPYWKKAFVRIGKIGSRNISPTCARFISTHFPFPARSSTDLRLFCALSTASPPRFMPRRSFQSQRFPKKLGRLFSFTRYNRNRDTNRETQRPRPRGCRSCKSNVV